MDFFFSYRFAFERVEKVSLLQEVFSSYFIAFTEGNMSFFFLGYVQGMGLGYLSPMPLPIPPPTCYFFRFPVKGFLLTPQMSMG